MRLSRVQFKGAFVLLLLLWLLILIRLVFRSS